MRKRSILQDVPAAEELEKNLEEYADVFAPAGGYDICSWRPEAAGSGAPCTEVHLILPVVEGVRCVLRLKSARALDELVAVLLEYRKDVFGS
jgi:hypothetical protein